MFTTRARVYYEIRLKRYGEESYQLYQNTKYTNLKLF